MDEFAVLRNLVCAAYESVCLIARKHRDGRYGRAQFMGYGSDELHALFGGALHAMCAENQKDDGTCVQGDCE